MSRLQTLQTRSTGAMTSVAQKFRGKQASCVGWREEQRIFHSIHDGIAEVGPITARQHDEGLEGCRGK